MRYELSDDEWATLTSLDKTKQRPPPCSCQRGSDRDALARASAEHPNSGDSKMATGDWGPVSGPNWPKTGKFQSPRASTLRKPAEFRGFFQETGDCRIGHSAWLSTQFARTSL
jgi:hypothetical protein